MQKRGDLIAFVCFTWYSSNGINFHDSCKVDNFAAQGPALRGGLLVAREGLSKSEIGRPKGADWDVEQTLGWTGLFRRVWHTVYVSMLYYIYVHMYYPYIYIYMKVKQKVHKRVPLGGPGGMLWAVSAKVFLRWLK